MKTKKTVQWLLIFGFSSLFLFSGLNAAEIEPSEIRSQTQQTPVTVLQNRYFLKALRPELGLVYGTLTNEAYTDTRLMGYRTGLFFNEWVGLEFQSFKTNVKDSDDRKALNQLTYKNNVGDSVKVDPEVNRISLVKDLSFVATPFYGKINLLDWLIIYSDASLSIGLSKIKSDQGDVQAITWGIGQRFYWQKSISMRIDFRDRLYNEKRNDLPYRKNTYSVDFGISYFLF